MKLKAKIKDCQLVVKVKLPYGQKIDEKDLNKFSRLYLSGFLKPRVNKPNKIEYTGPVGVTLRERLQIAITKRDLLQILEQIVVAVQRLEKNQLPLKDVLLDLDNIYINDRTKILQFLYVPVAETRREQRIEDLIESILYAAVFHEKEEEEFAAQCIFFVKSLHPFSVNEMERFIEREDRSVVDKIRKISSGQSGFITDKHQHYYEHMERNQKNFGDDENTLPLVEEDTALLEEEEDTALLAEEDTALLNEEEEDGTTLLAGNRVEVHFPTLYRISTEETISVNKPVFRLGKERSYVDYFVTNNTAVSRGHADIITRGQQYFVLDLNSKNHTYINEKMIPVRYEVEIRDGDKLTLGNEEFVFHE